jgi:arsenical pump membrane protein
VLLAAGRPVSTSRARTAEAEPRVGPTGSGEWLVGWIVGGLGAITAVIAALAQPAAARSAASQNWSAFVLVAGLLLIGLVADDDGVFAVAGGKLARSLRSGRILFIGAAALIGAVTALLNLDTSVAFLTPVLVYTGRRRGAGEVPLLYGCLLLSNAASLFLPGSNLTNLIVLGHLHLTGVEFLDSMWAPALAAVIATAAVIAFVERGSLRASADVPAQAERPVLGVGLLAITVAAVLVIALPSPALPVAAVGAIAVAIRLCQRKDRIERVLGVLGVPVLVGLFGLAVALGTLGRAWSGPTTLLSHLDQWGTAAVAACGSILFNNLPAASLMSARAPNHPFALLIGLNLGPNLFVTGSLAWILWLRAARTAGAQPSIAKAARLGAIAAPLSIAAAVGALILAGSR